MIRWEYHPELIEQTVFLAAKGDRRFELELHCRTDPIYSASTDRHQRNQQFQACYHQFFVQWGLDQRVPGWIQHWPIIDQEISRGLIVPSLQRKSEGIELLVQSIPCPTANHRTLLIRVQPQSLLDPSQVETYFRRDLQHVADMLDPAFCYQKESMEGLPARQNLVRDRYRVLWDIYVEGRLSRMGFIDEFFKRKLVAQFEKTFNHSLADASFEPFERAFIACDLTHRQLLNWAKEPTQLLGMSSSNASSGNNCPLCGFPTFDWFVFGETGEDWVAAIELDFPGWCRSQGVCRQCAELYQSRYRSSWGVPFSDPIGI